MDDTLHGIRDKRGHWTPHRRPQRAPIFVWPVKPMQLLRWLPSYLLPWNAAYFAIALVSWTYLTPPLQAMREVHGQWLLLIFLRNAALTVAIYGGLHHLLYWRRRQQTSFKYNARWPDAGNKMFWFGSQTTENVLRTLCIGVPVWTAYEAFIWWMYANGNMPWIDFDRHPVYFIAMLVLMPAWRELHFYAVHRIIHLGPLYHIIHKAHHKNVNPGPWSGLSMSTLEHIGYFSGVLIHLLVPSHPLHAMFQLMHAGLSPAKSHVGFDRIVVNEERAIRSDNFYHYLHHRYFEVNYGERRIPLDEWFGTDHDGSAQADERMYLRLKAKKRARDGAGSSQ